jgi:hypothetical protein
MTLRTEGLIKGFRAAGTITPRRLVKFDTTDTTIVQSAAVGDFHIGVSDLGGALGQEVDVIMSGVAIVEFGGPVTRGALLTSDASGRAVAAAPAAGTNNRIIGVAMVSGVIGDLGSVLVGPGSVQG